MKIQRYAVSAWDQCEFKSNDCGDWCDAEDVAALEAAWAAAWAAGAAARDAQSREFLRVVTETEERI